MRIESTETLGGTSVTPEQQERMQAGDYILHARDGLVRELPVVKTRLPRDPKAHYQETRRRGITAEPAGVGGELRRDLSSPPPPTGGSR